MRFDRLYSTIDAHAAGEPLRIITAGVPPLPGASILDRRRLMAERYDHIRRVLLFEPRGHADMYGAILTPPATPEADYGVLFLTNEGYSTMCGHGVIALTTALIETGMHPVAGDEATIVYDAPAGPIRARATLAGDRVTSVAFRNVPAFVLARDLAIDSPAGPLRVDVAWGGAFYAIVDASDLGIPVRPERTADLTRAGMAVKRAVERAIDVAHPTEPDLSGLYGTIVVDAPSAPDRDGRNVTIYAEGAVDRSPCGTGTSARLAQLHARGRVGVGQPYVHESLIGTTFTGAILGETRFGGLAAVETEIAGRGFLTGLHQFVVDPDDPTAAGFLPR
jgi:proline racemase